MKTFIVAMVLGAALACPPGARAADQSANLQCAIADAHQCGADAACTETNPDELNFPRFLTVDFAGKRISGNRIDGSNASSEIRGSFRQEDRVMLIGVEGGRGWSVVIADDGSLSLTMTDAGVSYSLFGYCQQR